MGLITVEEVIQRTEKLLASLDGKGNGSVYPDLASS